MSKVVEAFRDLALARYLGRRTFCRPNAHVVKRKSDGTLWVASSPVNIGYAMRGLFRKDELFHFHRARLWRGLLIVAPRIFWRPKAIEFMLLWTSPSSFNLAAWPEVIECMKIDAPSPTLNRTHEPGYMK